VALQRLDFLAGIQLVDLHRAIRTRDDRLPVITGHSDAIDHISAGPAKARDSFSARKSQ